MFTPDYVDPEAPFSERQLVCEGECNPDIRDFDSVVGKVYALDVREQRMVDNTIVEWVRRLKHTAHLPETATAIFRSGMGWCRAWRCIECGHKRYY